MLWRWIKNTEWFQRWQRNRIIRRQYAVLEQHRRFYQLQADAGAIFSRTLNQRDTVACCTWVLECCPLSLQGSIGQGNRNIAVSLRDSAQRTMDQARSVGLSDDHDWVGHPIRFVLGDARERMLFKLMWG